MEFTLEELQDISVGVGHLLALSTKALGYNGVEHDEYTIRKHDRINKLHDRINKLRQKLAYERHENLNKDLINQFINEFH